MKRIFLYFTFISLFTFTCSAFSNQTLPVVINGESYQVEYWTSYFAKELDINYMDSDVTDKIDIQFYRGKIVGHPDSLVTLSKFKDSLKGMAFFYGEYFEIDGSMSSMENQSNTAMQSAKVELADLADKAAREMCPIHTKEHHDMEMAARATMSVNTGGAPPVAFAVGTVNLVADVALALDPEYVLVHGGETNAVVKALQTLDTADMLYRQSKPAMGAGGLGVALNNVNINVYTNALPFNVADIIDPNPNLANGNRPEIDASAYLDRIRLNVTALFGNARTVGAMFSGYDLDDTIVGDGVAGLAYLTSTCSNFGVSVEEGWGTDAESTIIAAHEIAHNFGSCHDGDGILDAANNICPISSVGCAANGGYIMGPFVNAAATQFSQCSIANIDSHIATQTCYKTPIDMQISLASAVPAVANMLNQTGSAVRTFNVSNMSTEILINIPISGSLENVNDPNNPNTEYTTVTLQGNNCNIAANRQSYTCTIANIGANNADVQTIVETITATGTGPFKTTTEYRNVAAAQQVDIEPQNSIVELTQTINVNAPVAPPAAPSNVQASPQNNGDIRVSWTDNSNNEAAFRLERSEDTVVYNIIQNNLPANTTSYTDSGLTEGTTYTYRVSAINAMGAVAAATTPSATSSTSVATVGGDSGGGGGGGGFYLFTGLLLLARLFKRPC